MAKRKATKQALAALPRELEALRLRQVGLTYDAIAARLGYATRASAWHAVHAALAATLQEPAEGLRELELARLDRLQLALWPKATAGNLRAVDRVLAIMRRRAALLGLDAPRRHHVAGGIDLRAYAAHVAADLGLDAGEVLAEAARIIAAVAGRDSGRPEQPKKGDR
jgi:hypothetical protein